MGIVGGMLGAFFISVNFKMAIVRKNWLKSKWIKPIETLAWSFVTASFFYWTPYFFSRCQPRKEDQFSEEFFKGWCINDKYLDALATLFWNTEGGVIRSILDNEIDVKLVEGILFMAVWYFFTITTYGTNVPAGLFLPGMIIGCILGENYFRIISDAGLIEDDAYYLTYRKKTIVLGCAGFMAGYTRMTYSLGIILMETTQDLSLFVPMIFTIIVSN
jgi:H+/Cl- antiporter ClcA